MQVKKTIMLVLSLCILLTTAGCWDSQDINKKALIMLVLTDKRDGEYIFYFEIPNLEKGSGQASEGGTEGNSTHL